MTQYDHIILIFGRKYSAGPSIENGDSVGCYENMGWNLFLFDKINFCVIHKIHS